MRCRRAEDRHHRVADELLDHAAVLLDALLGLPVIRVQHLAHVLGIGLVRPGGRVDQVDEEDGHELALLLRRRGLAERRAAAAAETCAWRVRLTTVRTADLDSSHPVKVLPTGPKGSNWGQ